MADLASQVVTSANALRSVWTGLQSVPRSALPSKCYVQWIKRAKLYPLLDGTVLMFPGRLAAWNNVQLVASASSENNRNPNEIKIGEQKLDFAVARHLSMISYLAVSWSIYDRLSNACGRIAGISDVAEHTKQNPKACEDFLGKKDILGFSSQLHIQHAYAWPLRVSYKIRNWLVHEGYEENGISLFDGDNIGSGFRLHDDAAKHLEECCGYVNDGGRIVSCCLSSSEECWPSRDLLTILDRYHTELDSLFTGLVKWSVDSFTGQITAFTARDRL